MSWIEDYVAIEERRAYLRERTDLDADKIVDSALMTVLGTPRDRVEAVRRAVEEALLA